MIKQVSTTIQFNNSNTLILDYGNWSLKSGAAVKVTCGSSVILVTANYGPLTASSFDCNLNVHYFERLYAAGRIPGGFLKREGRQTEKEILISRLIDRSFRPLIEKEFNREIQVVIHVLSYDQLLGNPDIMAIYGTSAALQLLQCPMKYVVAAARISLIGEEYVVNPNTHLSKTASMQLVVAGNKDQICMIECEGDNTEDEKITLGISIAQEHIGFTLHQMELLVPDETQLHYFSTDGVHTSQNLIHQIVNQNINEIMSCFLSKSSYEIEDIFRSLIKKYQENISETELQSCVNMAIEQAKKEAKILLKNKILSGGSRVDGRNNSQVRDIEIELGILPSTHGSALFTRGGTQALGIIALDSEKYAQTVEGIETEAIEKDSFMLHYYFHPFASGETGKMGSPRRREIGHGFLAKKAILPVLPDDFGYTIRAVSEIISSDGSSSMATICAISLALIQAGVTLKNLVAGVAMGLLKDEKRFCILTDIGHREDMFGDLDFKVGGTKKGINAIQMDISADIDGITLPIIIKLLKRARQALDLILEKMEAALTMCATSTNAPKMKKIQVDPKKIKFIIGKGGATIKNITKTAGVSIDVKDDGTILVFGDNDKNIQTAIDLIELQVKDKELTMNKQYSGKIVRILPYGVFINLVPGRDAFMNIKKIKEQYGEEIKEGMQVEVILTGIDENGKLQINLVK